MSDAIVERTLPRPGRRYDTLGLVITTIALAALGIALPALGVSGYVRTLVYYGAFYLALGQAWNIMSGLTGYLSFAHGALSGIGAYGLVIAMNADWPMGASLAAAGAAAVLASLVIGATSLRLRGAAFTFATLFFQELMLLAVRKLPFAGGPGGLVLEQILPEWIAYVGMILLAAVATIGFALIRRSRLGIRVLAIKGDEDAAASVGIAATRLKLILFCVSALVAGLAGAVHALFTASLYPDVAFSVDLSLIALAVPLIGGVATASGPALGALLYVGLREVLQLFAPSAHLTILGLLLLAVVLFMRDGIGPTLARLVRRAR
jgi:branched-chain amino acid transport system permease protein